MVLWGTLGYYLFGNHKDIQLHLIFDKRQACPFIGRNDFLNANHKNVCLGRTVVQNLKKKLKLSKFKIFKIIERQNSTNFPSKILVLRI